jgi:hypothetical protein
MGRKPNTWTCIDRRYESIRIEMQDLFRGLGISTTPGRHHFADHEMASGPGAHGESQPHLVPAVWLRAGEALLRR